jgi:hypothetical protein
VLTVRTSRGRTAGLIAVAVVILLPGCDQSAQHAQPAPISDTTTRSASPPSTPPPTSANQRLAVEAAYRKFWAVSWDVDKQPPSRWRPVLASVSVDPELTRLYAGTKAQQQAGIRLYGHVEPHPSVRQVTGDSASIVDCQDASHAGQADARTGRPKTVGVARSPVEASLRRGTDGVWRVSDVRYKGGAC